MVKKNSLQKYDALAAVALFFAAQAQLCAGEARLRPDDEQEHSTCRAPSPSARTRPAPAPMRSLPGLPRSPARRRRLSAKVQPYNGPNAWMPLLESGEIEFGIINILDSQHGGDRHRQL